MGNLPLCNRYPKGGGSFTIDVDVVVVCSRSPIAFIISVFALGTVVAVVLGVVDVRWTLLVSEPVAPSSSASSSVISTAAPCRFV